MILIGLVGEIGSGKSVFIDLLKEVLPGKKIVLVNYSDTLKDTLDLWFLEHTRENFRKIATLFNTNFSDSALGQATLKRSLAQEADMVVMAGLRWLGDLERLKAFKGLLVYVTADERIRFERVRVRGEKANETNISFEDFIKEGQAPNELSIRRLSKEADFVITNNGTLKEFKAQVEEFVKEFLYV